MRGMKIAETNRDLNGLLKFFPMKMLKPHIKNHIRNYYHKNYPIFNLSNIGLCSPNQNHKDEEEFNYIGSARITNMSFFGLASSWLQLGVVTYNNRMVITLSVAYPPLSLEKYEQLMNSFIQELAK